MSSDRFAGVSGSQHSLRPSETPASLLASRPAPLGKAGWLLSLVARAYDVAIREHLAAIAVPVNFRCHSWDEMPRDRFASRTDRAYEIADCMLQRGGR